MESRVTNEESSTQLTLGVNRDGLLVAARHCAPGTSLLYVGCLSSFFCCSCVVFIGEWTGGAAFDQGSLCCTGIAIGSLFQCVLVA